MTGYLLYGAVVVTVALWLLLYRSLSAPRPVLPGPRSGRADRVCDSEQCMAVTPHRITSSGCAICSRCGFENPAPRPR